MSGIFSCRQTARRGSFNSGISAGWLHPAIAARQDDQAKRAHARLLEGIVDVQSRGKDCLFCGAPVRGTEITLSLRRDHFAGEGDLFLFASVLCEFFALYASLNSFTELLVKETEQGDIYSWPIRIGQQAIL